MTEKPNYYHNNSQPRRCFQRCRLKIEL